MDFCKDLLIFLMWNAIYYKKNCLYIWKQLGRNVYRMVTSVQNALTFDGSSYVPNKNMASSTILPDSSISASSIVQGINTAKDINSIPIYKSIFKSAAADLKGISPTYADEAIPNFGIIKNTFLGKICPNLAKADKTLADLQFSKDSVKKIFDCEIKEVGNTGELAVNGASKAGKFLSKTMGRIPLLNLALASACRIPNITAAVKNDDLGKECVRSTANILLPTVASSMAGQIACQLAPKSLKTVIAVASSIGTGILASKITDKTLDKVMGESIQAQNTKAKAKLATMKNERALITDLS